jgi:hypothetical protein
VSLFAHHSYAIAATAADKDMEQYRMNIIWTHRGFIGVYSERFGTLERMIHTADAGHRND